MTAGKKFRHPPLAEAVFEIRYEPVNLENMSELVADLSGKLTDFPEYEDLHVPPLPKEIPEAAGIVRYRFRSGDRAYLYQVGTGVLSVNVVNYTTFDDFRNVIRQVLDQHQKTFRTKFVKRIGLRYINKIKAVEKTPDNILSFGQKSPENLPDPVAWNSQFQFLVEGKQLKVITGYTAETQEVILDLDCFSSGLMANKLDDLLSWVDSAHQHIETVFISSLEQDFVREIS